MNRFPQRRTAPDEGRQGDTAALRRAPRGKPNAAEARNALARRRAALERRRRAARERRRAKGRTHRKRYGVMGMAERALRLCGLYARGYANALQPRLVRETFRFQNLPAAFDGYRILHLTDCHFDGRPGYLDAIVDLVTPIECDLCCLTGDYGLSWEGPTDAVREGLQEMVGAVNARDGCVGILGNHDFTPFIEWCKALGVTMLMNEHTVLRRDGDTFVVGGVDDPHTYRCADVSVAFDGAPPDAFVLLLAHSPEIIAQAARHGVHFYLCGHTHGGQICLPVAGAVLLNTRARRTHCRGRWRYSALQGYTSRGLGSTDLPLRYHCPPEATLIELRRV